MYDARIDIIREAQLEGFQAEYKCLLNKEPLKKKSNILALTPRLDEEGIMRCDSRICQADYLPYDARFPIILPRKHKTTSLIVRHFHNLGDHQGTNFILGKLSSKYWIVAAREEIRECEHSCFECRRRKTKIATQIMAPLPRRRLAQSFRSFTNIGVDYRSATYGFSHVLVQERYI